VLDNLTYGDHGIADLYGRDRFEFVEGDMRSIETVTEAIQGMDAVVHLGALVGDPASAIEPRRTLEINYHAITMAASICKYHQVNRFLFASTCSVYGDSESPDELLTEESALNPVSLYAGTKLESEEAVLDMEDENFSPTVFRMATIYGLSPRMRFDLVVNLLSAKAHTEDTVPIFGGDQYRPNVHVTDAARAYIACLEAPIDRVSGEVYNVGSNEQNYRIMEVGEIVASCFPDAEIDHQPEQEDERTYQVAFSKIHEELGFGTERTIRDGCAEIREAFEDGRFQDFTASKYSNYRSLQGDNPIFGPGEIDTEERTPTD
jgi:nucleoside-diphosphate-sugar epimerase